MTAARAQAIEEFCNGVAELCRSHGLALGLDGGQIMAPNIETAIERVKHAIAEIRHYQKQWQEEEANPASAERERLGARRAFEISRREFNIQWENVEFILKEKGL